MEMPERIKENSDKTLTVYVDEVPFDIGEKQYLKSDKGKILLKHQTIVGLAKLNNVIVEEPRLVHTHSPVVYVFSRTATRGDLRCTEIGESNGQSLYDDIMKITPATTADNRAYERAVLKVLGLYGEAYGASEIDYRDGKKQPPSVSQTEPKDNKKDSIKKNEPEDTIIDFQTATKTENKPFWWDDTGVGVFKESLLEPDTFIVTHGQFAGKNWTVKQLYDYQYNSCKYYAERSQLENADDEFKKQVYACRRAIRKYGVK
jgi:hypothetical protein